MSIWTKFWVVIISWIVWHMPKPIKVAWARALGWLWFDGFRLRRMTILKNLTIAFPDWSKEKRYQVARESMAELCMNLPEFLSLHQMSADYVEKEVIFEGLEHFHRAREEKKGVLLLSMHMGNGDMGVSVMSLKGLPIHLISKKFKNKFLNALWFGVRESKGTKFIDPHGAKTAFEILAALKKNEAVIFVVDQFMGRPYGIETHFFGRKTGTAYGLALFAIKTGAPVLPVYTYRDQDLKTHLVIEPPIPLESNADRDLQILTMTEKYNLKIEEIIRRSPQHWMWVHRRWKRWE
ncbi:MAG: lipid A lauroyl acyltransferase [Oligoflexia bacterium]|nr:MAG: lipid A lauroyl acyltransferase [Oligoflexia bacterium]